MRRHVIPTRRSRWSRLLALLSRAALPYLLGSALGVLAAVCAALQGGQQ